ncbi:unnamed protein product [Linum trigynum]|uniref:Uncharacterized protein n=1 Tax=Linum trigynum TaxID=586398 RepID=A0AAV2DSS1_9ROSI
MRNHNIEDCYKLKKKQSDQKNGNGSNLGSSSSSSTPRFTGSVSQPGFNEAQSEGGFSSEGSVAQAPPSFTPEEMNRLRYLLQVGTNTSPSPPTSPSIDHQAYSVSQFLAPFPNHSGKYVLSSAQNCSPDNLGLWILDRGASDHTTCSKSLFT